MIPPFKSHKCTEDEVWKLIDADLALLAYEQKLNTAREAARAAHEAMHGSSFRVRDVREKLAQFLEFDDAFTKPACAELSNIVVKLSARQAEIKSLRESVAAEIAMLRRRARKT
jgi:hypothetical protein